MSANWSFWVCPVCGHPLPRTHGIVNSRESPCDHCGSLLGVSKNAGIMLAVLSSVLLGAMMWLGRRVALWMGLVLLAAYVFTPIFLRPITVLRNRNPGFCRGCRYDLTGTVAAGIERCPECGTPTTAKPADH